MSTIIEVHGREILDSRGNPTVEVRIGAPIPTTGMTYEQRDALRDRVWAAMHALGSG